MLGQNLAEGEPASFITLSGVFKRGSQTLRQVLRAPNALEVKDKNAWLFAGHVLVNRYDIDISMAERFKNALQLTRASRSRHRRRPLIASAKTEPRY